MNNTFISRLLFADDRTVLKKSKHDLQTAVYKLTQISKNYNFKIHTNKPMTGIQSRIPYLNKNCNKQWTDCTNKDITM
jgi:hypothetical protein